MSTSPGNVNLAVTDLARSRTFYAGVIGSAVDTRRSHAPTFALLRAGSATLTLQAVGSVSAFGGIVEPGRGVHVGFEVDDLEAIRTRLRALGRNQAMGSGRAVDMIDTDGYRLTVFVRGGEAQ